MKVFEDWHGPRFSLLKFIEMLPDLYGCEAINIQVKGRYAYICIAKMDNFESRCHFNDWDYKLEVNC